MNKWREIVEKYKYFLLSIAVFCVAGLLLYNEQKNEFNLSSFQDSFLKKEQALNAYTKEILEVLPLNKKSAKNPPFYTYIYKDDSLAYWNSNNLPVSKYTTIQFPTNGLLHLQNGWYYCKTLQRDDVKVCCAFEIKKEFSYENEFLVNQANEELSKSLFDLSFDEEVGKAIYNHKKQFVFSVIPLKNTHVHNHSPFTIIALILAFLILVYSCYERFQHTTQQRIVLLIALMGVRLLLYEINFSDLFNSPDFLSADLFAYNEWFPSFFDLCLNLMTLSFIGLLLFKSVFEFQKKILVWLSIFVLYFIWWLILQAINLVVINSTIPLNLENLFSLNEYSFLFLLLFGLVFISYQQTFTWLTKSILKLQIPINRFAAIFYSVGIIFAILKFRLSNESFVPIILPILLFSANLFYVQKLKFSQKLAFQLIVLGLFSASFVSDLTQLNAEKDKETRILYGNQLSVEQDINLELDFGVIKNDLLQDPLLLSSLKVVPSNLSVSDFGDILEKRHFKGAWESYEMSFNLFDSLGISLISKETQAFEQIEKIILRNGEKSQIDSSLFFIRDAVAGYNYIVRQEVSQAGKHATLIITLKSKRIPEEIGFPRLLLSNKSKVLTSLEKYSIAKYAGNRLIKHFGEYNFPTYLRSFPTPSAAATFIDFEGYNHYYYKKTNNAVIILSTKNKTWFESITSFSYVFSFWGLLLVIIILFSGSKLLVSNALTLAFKIQFVLVLMVVLALLLFGTGSGIFVGRQYQSYTDRIISEKLHSVEEELRGKVSNYNTLNLENNGNYLEGVLLKLSKVFVTDLNIYDPNGYLIASSRPKIFNLGLLGEQINPQALNELKRNNKSFFSHREEIGKLSYISSYLPLYNSEGKLLGYTNLQHFGQQRDFEDQIQQFIVAIINVFILLLAISIIISLIVSNWLTAPLRVLSEKVAALKFGGENEKIAYEGTDEIGTIVRAYNLKLEELEEAARQLAKSERESAWREMAKQVAHEIKNPLTPMKLGIQHLMRSYDPNVEGAKEKLERVFNSLIEQIDGLTRIANEFSNFAKMPEPNKQLCDLIGIIRNTLTLFEMEANNKIHLETNTEELLVNIDKNQWIQVFNNLLKNAIQALVGRENGTVTIHISKDETGKSVMIQISDTGCGISDEQKEKIFIPHFTTKSTGSGIGLSVVKQIIENHGGNIYFESVENEGTTFTVILPIE